MRAPHATTRRQQAMKQNREERVMKELSGDYKHYCPDWDGMAIDEHCPEFNNGCTCVFERRTPNAS